MTETVKKFIEEITVCERWEDRLPEHLAYYWPMPREMMIALRDELRETARLEAEHDALLENLQPFSLASDGGEG